MAKGYSSFLPAGLFGLVVISAAAMAAGGALAQSEAPGTNVKLHCLPVNMIDRTRIIDDQTIMFEMRSGSVYRNVLGDKCPGLKRQDRFGYKSTTGQLCAHDLITVLPTMGISGPTCALGEFELTREQASRRHKSSK